MANNEIKHLKDEHAALFEAPPGQRKQQTKGGGSRLSTGAWGEHQIAARQLVIGLC